MPKADVVIGLASLSLATGRGANRRQAKFVLDRACPHVDFQQKLVCDESQKVGIKFKKQPRWFRERQLEEYEIADLILTPSRYTAQTFPEHLRHKVHIAPLMGRTRTPGSVAVARHQTFTVGMVGLEPLRKGYLYLLEAWKQLALPNAKLLIRSSADFSRYGRLQELLKELPNVEVVPYVPDMANFYALCDVFVLPSMDDGFGMALFEAMANGRPCITTRNCGASELLTNGVDGIVIDAGDSRQIAEAVPQLYREDELRQSIALAGKATAERVKDTALYEQALVGGLQLSR
jgi:glycosyltransferase involved in cell wall biosynthesis